jgi:distribution and morphology protein 31
VSIRLSSPPQATHARFPAGLTDAIALQIYEALAYHVTRSNMNRRIRAVSTWSLQMTANAVISALRNIVDPVSAHLREISSDEHLYLG